MKRLFITATGTGVGKTFVTAGLAHAARTAGLKVRVAKPVISGFTEDTVTESDTAILLDSVGLPLTHETIAACSPWRFQAPLSPDMAAAREGRSIDFAAVAAWCVECKRGPEDVVLIEGVGGVMVPLDESRTIRNLIAQLEISVVLVAGSYLGTLSHTLTALEALQGCDIAALVISESPESPVPLAETAATLARFTRHPIVLLPRLNHWRDADPVTMHTLLGG